MKVLAGVLVAARLAIAHGPGKSGAPLVPPPAPTALSLSAALSASVALPLPSIALPKPAVAPIPAAVPAAEPASAEAPLVKTKTPAGCRQKITDETYPDAETWKAALPKALFRNIELEGDGHTEYKIRAETYQDVIDGVKFASKHNLRLSVINSGHDFVGRNDAPTGLVIDVSLLAGINALTEFVATEKGAEKPVGKGNIIEALPGKQAAVTIGAGVSTQILNNALHKSKLVTVGAAHGSVATAGGFGQTSGHSPISDLYGLGSDNFLEFKVVTADGNLRVANKVSNPELFWALRGGGGSTFGVVVEATLKAHPTVPVTIVQWNLNNTGTFDNPGIWDSYAELHRTFPELTDKNGVSGYYYHYGSRIGSIWLHKGENAGKDKADAVWKPILKRLEAFPDVKLHNYSVIEYPAFKQYFDARFGAIDKPGMEGMAMRRSSYPFVLEKRHEPESHMMAPAPKPMANLDSRLLGKAHFDSKNLTAALKAAFPTSSPGQAGLIQGHLVGGNKVHKPEDPDTAVLPAWRKAYTHVIGYRNPGKTSVNSLIQLSPDSGAYANEAYALSDDWKNTFWGSNYEKLSQLKIKYDPQMLFWVSPGINADLYEAKDGRQCKRTTAYTGKTCPPGDSVQTGRVLGRINK